MRNEKKYLPSADVPEVNQFLDKVIAGEIILFKKKKERMRDDMKNLNNNEAK
ncbi:hypothetical protein [Xanthocytophaga agilis]|uniref:Uncharacterized protein n=1 Tax=Xanthocytophaga agilis TaxID=3048010 RepID=A0AAE3QZ23_9BACT|nr:hypothetical protein [Xanthocytophaga agilis]MDJ1500676.1 hypothetical protein [Xanthocytophaga agilis]